MNTAHEYKVVSLRECADPMRRAMISEPLAAVRYWRKHIAKAPQFNPEVECMAVLMLNARRRVKGHVIVALGTVDSVVVHPREVFRAAIIASAHAVIAMHNHPSGDPTPSQADIKVNRDFARAGQLLKMEVIDHIIIGKPKHCSLKELGYFYQ